MKKSSYTARWGNERTRKAKHLRRIGRQQRAAERQAEYDALSDAQKAARSSENRAAYQREH